MCTTTTTAAATTTITSTSTTAHTTSTLTTTTRSTTTATTTTAASTSTATTTTDTSTTVTHTTTTATSTTCPPCATSTATTATTVTATTTTVTTTVTTTPASVTATTVTTTTVTTTTVTTTTGATVTATTTTVTTVTATSGQCSGGTCKVCAASATGGGYADGEFSLTVSFGQLQKGGAINEGVLSAVNSYKVQLMSDCGEVLEAAHVAKGSAGGTCCDEGMYSVTMTSSSMDTYERARYVLITGMPTSGSDDGGVRLDVPNRPAATTTGGGNVATASGAEAVAALPWAGACAAALAWALA